MTMPYILTEDEATSLAQAMQMEQRAQQKAEAALLVLTWQEAVDAKQTLLTQLGAVYGFDPSAPLRFDRKTRTLALTNGNG